MLTNDFSFFNNKVTKKITNKVTVSTHLTEKQGLSALKELNKKSDTHHMISHQQMQAKKRPDTRCSYIKDTHDSTFSAACCLSF